MPAERYFIEEDLNLHETKILKETEFHHLVRVMRAKKGELVELVNGRGSLATGIIQEISKDKAFIVIQDLVTTAPRTTSVILAQAMPKINRLDFILEKGTELGADEFWLFPGQLSVKKEFFPHQLERLQALTIAAMKQCGRLFLPKITLKPELNQWPLQVEHRAFFGDVDPQAPLFSQQWNQTGHLGSPIIFFIGPESGFTDKETTLLKQKGVQGVRLHSNILRTDTAPIMALSLIEHWLMSEFNQ